MLLFLMGCLLLSLPFPALADTLDSYTPPVFREFRLDVRPIDDQTASIRIFLPEAAGQKAFGYAFEFDDTARRFSSHFRIKSSRAYHVLIDQNNASDAVNIEKHIDTPANNSTGRRIAFPHASLIPAGGLIAELILESVGETKPTDPGQLRMHLSVLSNTPPERLWKYSGIAPFSWP